MNTLLEYLKFLYPDCFQSVYQQIEALIAKWRKKIFGFYDWVSERDVLLIAYGDGIRKRGEKPLKTLKRFMDKELAGYINLIHLLPIFPYSSDDGFSVVDFRRIDPALGTWEDIDRLRENYDLMFDAVLNHVSRSSRYFEEFLKCSPKYKNFFITASPAEDYSAVVRPRTTPLFTAFDTAEGRKYVWTTFSSDQIDLNYREPAVLLEMLDILLLYASRGARFIRFDAAGFLWKEKGTTCMHLPQVHILIKLMRLVLQQYAKGCTIITETNVPHRDNISYFGNGRDEAGLVYQFPLPPLTLYAFLSGRADKLTAWAASLEETSKDTTFFNFLASHDGIGMRPVEDILDEEQKKFMVESVLKRGGQVSYRTTQSGSEVPYELNINYLDAVAGDEGDTDMLVRKYMASQCVLLSMAGMPAVYYHSLLGSRNCYEDCRKSGIKRRINREKLDFDRLEEELSDPRSIRSKVLAKYKELISKRKQHPAFHPNSGQKALPLDDRVFALLRGKGEDRILVLINVSGEAFLLKTAYRGRNILDGRTYENNIWMAPYQYLWIKLN